MKFRGIIRNVGKSTTGTSKTTGREWTKRELVIAVAYPKSLPKEGTCETAGTESPSLREGFRMGSSLMVGSYFGEATEEQLLALADTAAPLEFTVFFDVHQHAERWYQDIRIGSIKSIV